MTGSMKPGKKEKQRRRRQGEEQQQHCHIMSSCMYDRWNGAVQLGIVYHYQQLIKFKGLRYAGGVGCDCSQCAAAGHSR